MQSNKTRADLVIASNGRMVERCPGRDNAFMTRWLPLRHPDIVDEAAGISVSVLADLYPDLYVLGPHFETVEANCRKILNIMRNLNLSGRDERTKFIWDFNRLYSHEVRHFYAYPQETEWDRKDFRLPASQRDPFSDLLGPVLAGENRAAVVQTSIIQESTVCKSFFLIPEGNYIASTKAHFLKSLLNYYRYTLLMEGDHYAMHRRKTLHDHLDFATKWGLQDCADSLIWS